MRAGRPITVRQMLVLDFIASTIRNYERPPTIREIGSYMRIRSTNGVNDHLRALVRKGLIVRDQHISRGIYLTASGKALTSAAAAAGPAGVCLKAPENRCAAAMARVA